MKIAKFIVLSILIALFQSNVKAQYSKIWEQAGISGINSIQILGAENTDTDSQKEILLYVNENRLYLLDGQSGNIEWQSSGYVQIGSLIDMTNDGKFEILFVSDDIWYLYGLPGMTIKEINGSNILASNYPNPFNQTTTIKYSVSENGTLVIVKIFDSIGQEIKTLVNEIKSAGEYEILFNGFNLSSGMYYYQVTIGNEIGTKKMIKME